VAPKRWSKILDSRITMIINAITRTAIEANRPGLKDLYAQWGKAFAHSMDYHYCLAEHDGNTIGAIRLAFEYSIFVARGFYVRREFRRCGVARKLLNPVEKELRSAEVYCLALENHEKPRAAIGRQKIVGLTAPAFLTARRKALQEKSEEVILMKRSVGEGVRPLLPEDMQVVIDLISEFTLPEEQNSVKIGSAAFIVEFPLAMGQRWARFKITLW
jgi:GNAT superfamily N-acetyltransferase